MSLVNIDDLNVKVMLDEKISDHSTISFNVCNTTDKSESRKVTKLCKYSKDIFVKNLLEIEWSCVTSCNIHEKAKFLSDSLKECVSEFIKTVNVNEKDNNEWYTNELREQRKLRDETYKQATATNDDLDWVINKEVSKTYSMNVKNVSQKYYGDKLRGAMGDQKATWKILKSIVNGVSNDFNDMIDFNGVKKYKNQDIANSFNEYFIDSVKEINMSIPNLVTHDSDENSITESEFKFDIINEDKIVEILKNIRSKGDFEFLNKKVLLDAMTVIGLPFVDIINTSLEVAECPSDWKTSMIMPTQKVPGTIKCNEFRPINMLPTYEKVLEAVIKEQMENYVEGNGFVIDEQSGYRKNHSCESTLNLVIINWKEQIESGNIVVAIFLDLKRTFETIDRQKLLKKLEKIGIRGVELNWFRSYLSNRFQKTKFNGEVSDERQIDLGVPQGSKLAALLFLLYINDIKECLLFMTIILFADDTLLYYCGKDINEINRRINEDLERINRWLCTNKLKLNIEKTKYMVITNRNLDQEINININGEKINQVYTMKYLGFILNCRLMLTSHLDYTCRKIAKKIGFLARISNKLTPEHRITIYKSIIAPHFEYCSSILSTSNVGEFSRLQKLQNRAMRIVLRCKKRTHVQDMMDALQWLSVKQRIMYRMLVVVFKIKNDLMPKYLSEKIAYVGDNHQYPLRNASDFRLVKTKLENNRKSLVYKCFEEFNKMPKTIKEEININNFKRKVTEYVKVAFK